MNCTIGVQDLFTGYRPEFSGVRVIESALCVIKEWDTSACRSPSRALRRYQRGISGRVRIVEVPTAIYAAAENIMFMHPDLVRAVERKASEGLAGMTDKMIWDAMVYGDSRAKTSDKPNTEELLAPSAAGTRRQW